MTYGLRERLHWLTIRNSIVHNICNGANGILLHLRIISLETYCLEGLCSSLKLLVGSPEIDLELHPHFSTSSRCFQSLQLSGNISVLNSTFKAVFMYGVVKLYSILDLVKKYQLVGWRCRVPSFCPHLCLGLTRWFVGMLRIDAPVVLSKWRLLIRCGSCAVLEKKCRPRLQGWAA